MSVASKRIISVVGASGLVGSNIVREALKRGYGVNGTMRNSADQKKASYLKRLPGAEKNLNLFDANMNDFDSFSNAFTNVDCVFVACLIPTFFGSSGKAAKEMDDQQGYDEIINPTVEGCLNILKSAAQKNIKNIVICSSTSSTNPTPSVAVKNEDHWSDVDTQCKAKKYTSAAKTVMEKTAMKFAEDNGIRLSIILPTGLFGPVIIPSHLAGNPHAWIKRLMEGGEGRHKKIPNDSTSLIHLHDLAEIFLSVYEKPEASGRFYGVYGSWHWQDIYFELQKILPHMKMPEPIVGKPVTPTQFDFSRRDSLGVQLRDIPTCLRETVDWLRTEPFK